MRISEIVVEDHPLVGRRVKSRTGITGTVVRADSERQAITIVANADSALDVPEGLVLEHEHACHWNLLNGKVHVPLADRAKLKFLCVLGHLPWNAVQPGELSA